MIQVYFYKKNFQVQKTERFFKERRTRLGRRELEAVKARVGLDALVDREGAAWKECPARFAAGEEAVFNALLEDPRRLVLPIVRNGKEATVGYRPEEWERWL